MATHVTPGGPTAQRLLLSPLLLLAEQPLCAGHRGLDTGQDEPAILILISLVLSLLSFKGRVFKISSYLSYEK